MLKRMYVEGESKGKLADPRSPGRMAVKPAWVCVRMCVLDQQKLSIKYCNGRCSKDF